METALDDKKTKRDEAEKAFEGKGGQVEGSWRLQEEQGTNQLGLEQKGIGHCVIMCLLSQHMGRASFLAFVQSWGPYSMGVRISRIYPFLPNNL